MADRDDTGWHLDRRVPLAIIVTLAMQTVGAVWWAASLNQRVAVLEQERRDRSDETGRIIRLETKMDQATVVLERLESKLDRSLPATVR
jgi:hypothetical protein